MNNKIQKISYFFGFYIGKIIKLFLPSILMIMVYHFYFTPKLLFFDESKHMKNLKQAYIADQISDQKLDEELKKLNHFSESLKKNEILFKESSILGKGKYYEKK